MTDRAFPSLAHSLILFRNELDVLEETQVTWFSYHDELPEELSTIYREAPDIWHAFLICHEVIEIHNPNHVMSQFGMRQHIPNFVVSLQSLEGKRPALQQQIYQLYAGKWDYRHHPVVCEWAELPQMDEYLTSYRVIGQRPIYTHKAPYIHSQSPICSLPNEKTHRAWADKFKSN